MDPAPDSYRDVGESAETDLGSRSNVTICNGPAKIGDWAQMSEPEKKKFWVQTDTTLCDPLYSTGCLPACRVSKPLKKSLLNLTLSI
jgi:hypothetical protein